MNAPLPRERLWRHGPGALSEAELLAIVLCTGRPGASVLAVAAELAKSFSGRSLGDASLEELCRIPGVGPAKAARLAAAVELGRRALAPPADRPVVRTAADGYALVASRLDGCSQELVVTLLLDAKGALLGEPTVALGGLSAVDLHPREVFRPAIRQGAASILLAHGHPSGDPDPSAEDLAVTRRLLDVSTIVGIPLLDHLVVGRGRYVSIRATTALWDAPSPVRGLSLPSRQPSARGGGLSGRT